MKLTRKEFADQCRTFGPKVNAPAGIDPVKLLWALGGKESTYGERCIPKHETGYCYGSASYKRDARLRNEMTEAIGCDAHCSWGPLQIMFWDAVSASKEVVSDYQWFKDRLETEIAFSMEMSVLSLNHRIKSQGLTTVREIADAWNSGSGKDAIIPAEYITAVEANYLVPLA